ncbi:MAG TPA: gas vesicle protein GvpG [Solirubrobacterales bacterium]|jgi:hypothetical protein
MGLFKELVLLPVAPLRGTVKVGEVLAEEAERRLYDEENIKRELIQSEIDAEEGRIGEAERANMEEELMERLAVSRRRRTEELEAERVPIEERPSDG